MPHWLEVVVTLLQSNTTDLRKLAILAGGNPETFYIGTDLEGLDLDDQDFTNMDFGAEQNARLLVKMLKKVYREQAISNRETSYFKGSKQLLHALSILPPSEQNITRQLLGFEDGVHSYPVLAKKLDRSEKAIQRTFHKAVKTLIHHFGGDSSLLIVERPSLNSASSTAEAIDEIRVAPRQEERLAILFRAILLNPKTGLRVLGEYTFEESKLANHTLYLMRKEIPRIKRKPGEIEQYIYFCIGRAITETYPMRKAEMLLYLAKHLADFPEAKFIIQKKLNSTRSMFVEPLRDEIQRLLDHPNRFRIRA